MDPLIKLKYTIDILFGHNTSKFLPKPMTFFFSHKNGRLRNVYYNDQLLCTLRIDGGLAISIFLAAMLLKNAKFLTYCLEVDKVSQPFIEKGRSVFCNHVTWCGKNVHIQSDVPVLYQNKVIAIGKAMLSSEMIISQSRGVAVKIRNSLKCHR